MQGVRGSSLMNGIKQGKTPRWFLPSLQIIFLLWFSWLQPQVPQLYLSDAAYLWCLDPSRTAGDAVDTKETHLTHATEQLSFTNYSYEAINQNLIEEKVKWS